MGMIWQAPTYTESSLPRETIKHPEGPVPHDKIDLESVVQWSNKPISTAVGDEVVLMSLDRGRCYGLGPVGTDLWTKIERPIRVAEVVEQLSQQYTAEPGVLEHDVLEVLDQYATEGLIEVLPGKI